MEKKNTPYQCHLLSDLHKKKKEKEKNSINFKNYTNVKLDKKPYISFRITAFAEIVKNAA